MTLDKLKKIFPHATADTWHQHKNPDGTLGGWVENTANVQNTCYVGPNALIFGNAQVYDNARISDNAQVYDNARIYGDALIFGNIQVSHYADIQWISPIGSKGGALTLIRHGNLVVRGCFSGTLDEFKRAVAEKRKDDPHRLMYEALFPYLDFWFAQPLKGKYEETK
jgi:hypothetical protein